MPEGQVLEFSGVTKRFGAVTAVSDFTARVEPGLVTGFLGPNGAGKTTSLRVLLGLVSPTAGEATIGGLRYAKLADPLHTVGAVLEASSFHPGRTAAAHLTVYAQAARIPRTRVDEVLGLVGLGDAAGRKVGGYSLGMRQRLGLAYALLGDPGVLVLDEPTNGLDPEGIKWIRGFLRQLAREGRTVLVSSHLLTEVQQTVDALVIISQGRLVFQGGLDELVDPSEQATVVDSPDRAALAEALHTAGVPYEVLRSGLTVRGIEPTAVGLAAAAAGVPLSSLHKRGPALEEVFLDLVNGTRLHASASGTAMADVIPALESGPIVIVTDEETTDASAAEPVASADAEPGPGPGPDAPAEELPDDAAWIASELDAAAGGAAAAGSLAAAEEALRAEERHAEPEWAEPTAAEPADEEHAPEDAEGAAPEADQGAPVAEPATTTASFAVASTGVIEIVPTGGEAEPVEEPEPWAEPEAEGEPAPWAEPETTGESEAAGEPEPTREPEPADEPEPEPEPEPAPVPADEPEAGSADEPDLEPELSVEPQHESEPEPSEEPDAESADEPYAPESDDRPWEEYVRTDSDVEADRFFAAFDTTEDGSDETPENGSDETPEAGDADQAADDTAPPADGSAEGEAPGADADHVRADDEAEEQR